MIWRIAIFIPAKTIFAVLGRIAACLLLGGTVCLMGDCHAAPASKQSSKQNDFYQLDANYDGVRLDVRVNDMPVILDKSGHGAGVHIINDLLTGASNTVTVTAKPLQGQAHASANASLHIDIVAFPPQGGGTGKMLYRYDWKLKDSRAPLPNVHGQFQTQPPLAPLSWQNAAILQKATLDKAGINAQIKRLHMALETKNAAETTALLASEAHDQEVSLGLPPDDPGGEQRKIYEEQFRQPNWGLTPVHYAALEYDLYGGGRVVHVHAPNERPAFTSTPDKEGVSTVFDFYLSFIDGRWVIVK